MENRKVDPVVYLFYTIMNTAQLISERIDKPIHKHGLNTTEFSLLQVLYFKGELPLQKIGNIMLLSSGSITYVVDKLEKKGIVKRTACHKDRRITYAQLTDSGIELYERIFPEYKGRVHEVLSPLTEKEQEITLHHLNKITEELKVK